jgi:malate dehydrogenase (oxaloacetate-decarboxylating)(NADP+)
MLRFRSLIKVTVPFQGLRSSNQTPRLIRYMATIANDNMSSTQRPSIPRQLSTTSGDYDLSYSPDVRKTLGTYGLTPPAVESYEVQTQRCESSQA